ncbi:MAG: secretin and TonB N-terminal domain-containing protein [Phycisphaerae bacterium]
MRATTKTAGLIFLAASSVCIDSALGQNSAAEAKPVTPAKADVSDAQRLLDALGRTQDPFAEPAKPTASDAETLGVESVTTVAPKSTVTSVRASDVNYDDEFGTVEIHVSDAPLVEVLRTLSLQSQKNIIASKDVRGTVTANLYGVTIREALDAILQANGFAYREEGNFIYVYTMQEMKEMEAANRKRATRVFRLHYTPASNAVNVIKPVLSADAEVSFTEPAVSGISSGTGEVGGNSHAVEDLIVVTDYEENLERVAEVVAEVDRRPQQVLVEATIMVARLNEDNDLGVDFNILAGVDFTQIVSSNGQIVGGNLPEGADPSITDSALSAGTGNNFTSPIGGGFKMGFVGSDVSVFVSALEGVTDTVILANPKVLALNKQKGEVLVGRSDGYVTTTLTDTTATQTVEFLETGTRLIFRPYIGSDGFIRMEIHPEDSAGGIDPSTNLPAKTTTEVTSNIMVRDGHTIVIGGLFRESSISGRSQVPLLGNIPVAGALFRNQSDSTRREEIIILLTPHIIKDETKYAKLSADELERLERLRVGVRKGMMPFGRERLADSAYQRAMEEMQSPEPDMDRVLWNLNIATNLVPTFVEAIELKRDVSGRELTTADGSSIRHFVRDAILTDVAAEKKPAVGAPRPENQTPPAAQAASEPFATTEVATDPTTLPTTAPTTNPVEAVEATSIAAGAPAEPTAPVTGTLKLNQPMWLAPEPAEAPLAATSISEEPAEEPMHFSDALEYFGFGHAWLEELRSGLVGRTRHDAGEGRLHTTPATPANLPTQPTAVTDLPTDVLDFGDFEIEDVPSADSK